ncbi:hypothetical protein G6321_00023465 [Bradyrhizobium barranii subsp. barranii]|uniref:Uncharacterized protein n=1 Tax=Bradyrhizobium barranii subsp. barranii TaxID=2823807 RepID=A0A7Z0TVI4_9BRAD|nr:hypothetical protein [Bradyrhizobium barranii]UGX97931.1 hypothetical protein G6321_00023465 [Bradyrhizobium barranii subsp. barranii]
MIQTAREARARAFPHRAIVQSDFAMPVGAAYRAFLRQMAFDPETEARIQELIADLESQLRSIDE